MNQGGTEAEAGAGADAAAGVTVDATSTGAPAALGHDFTADLPDELLIAILSRVGFLDGCRCVCRRWHQLCSDRELNGQSDWERWTEIARDRDPPRIIRQTNDILVLDVSPNGEWLCGGILNNVYVWRAHDGEQLRKFEAHRQPVRSLAAGSDGTVYTGSQDETICVWCVGSGQLLWRLEGHTSYVLGLAVNATHLFSVGGGADRTIRSWSTSDGAHVNTYTKHTDAVVSLLFDEVQDTLYSGSCTGVIEVCTASSFTHLRTLKGHEAAVDALAVGFRQTLFSGGRDHSIRVWSPDGVLQRTLSTDYTVQSLLVRPSGILFYGTVAASVGAIQQGSGGRRAVLALPVARSSGDDWTFLVRSSRGQIHCGCSNSVFALGQF